MNDGRASVKARSPNENRIKMASALPATDFMKNDPENKPSLLSDEEKIGWDFYVSIGVQGADDLRKELGLDELNFRRLAPNVNQKPKEYFLYRILDEIQKAALKIFDWK